MPVIMTSTASSSSSSILYSPSASCSLPSKVMFTVKEIKQIIAIQNEWKSIVRTICLPGESSGKFVNFVLRVSNCLFQDNTKTTSSSLNLSIPEGRWNWKHFKGLPKTASNQGKTAMGVSG